MLDFRPVLYALGPLLGVLAGFMLVPAATDYLAGNDDWQVFLTSAAVTLFTGVALILGFRDADARINLRQGFLLTGAAWIVVAAFAALPLRFASIGLDYPAAYFEAMSGLTTTGSTTIADLSMMPPGMLLWRGLLNGLGGAGIIVMALVMLPFLSIGGMQLFRMESSDRSDKIFPRINQIAGAVVGVYVLLIGLCALCFWLAGMPAFDAVVHAMAALATGGFANLNDSFASYPPQILWIGTVFMAVGGMPLVLFVLVLRRGPQPLLSDPQVRAFLLTLVSLWLVMALWLWQRDGAPFPLALTHAAFNVTSIMTTTGFASADWLQWGGFAAACFTFLFMVGGCTGSTSGGIKIFRFQILLLLLRRHRIESVFPHAVEVRRYAGRTIGDDVVRSVLVLFALYGATVALIAMGLGAVGLDLLTALGCALSAVGNIGPGLTPATGPMGNFAHLPDAAKWLMALGMLMGRLEFSAVFVMLSRRFWQP